MLFRSPPPPPRFPRAPDQHADERPHRPPRATSLTDGISRTAPVTSARATATTTTPKSRPRWRSPPCPPRLPLPLTRQNQILAERLSLYFQAYTLYSSVRPFALSAIVAGWDAPGSDPSKGTPAMYCIEPSGVYWGYRGCAVGKGRQLARTEIEKLKLDEMTAEDALVEAARMYVPFLIDGLLDRKLIWGVDSIHTVHDEAKDKDFELELSWIGPQSGWKHAPVPKDIADAAEAKAKAIIDEANQMEE